MKIMIYLGLAALVLSMYLSTFVPFVYKNIEFLIFIFGYIFLLINFFRLVIVHNSKIYYQNSKEYLSFKDIPTVKDRLLFVLLSSIWPLCVGWMFSLSTPLLANFFASDFEIREYRVKEIIKTSRRMGYKEKIIVTNIINEPASFIIRPEMARRLNLQEGEKIITSGRRFPGGFVIDQINGQQR